MLTLDLFNTRHEQELHEGAVDNTIARLIEPLSQRAADVRTQLRNGNLSPAEIKALEAEYEDLVAKRLDIIHGRSPAPQDECMGYGSLGEAGLPDVANKANKMARLNQPGKAGTDVVTPQQRVNPNPNKGIVGHAKDWLTGKGGPGKEGPTYESELDEEGNYDIPPKYLYVIDQIKKGFDEGKPGIDVTLPNNETVTLTRTTMFNILASLGKMSRKQIKRLVVRFFNDKHSLLTLLNSPYIKRYQTPPVPKPVPPHPGQGSLGLDDPNKIAEAQKKNSKEADLTGTTAGDPIVARELRKIRGRQPSARSDVEALMRDEMDRSARTEQQLAQQEAEIDRQQQQLTQLTQANQTQSSDITAQGREIDNLTRDLQQARADLQAVKSTPAIKAEPAATAKTEPTAVEPEYMPPPVPTDAKDDAKVQQQIQDLSKQLTMATLQMKEPGVSRADHNKLQQAVDTLQKQIEKLSKRKTNYRPTGKKSNQLPGQKQAATKNAGTAKQVRANPAQLGIATGVDLNPLAQLNKKNKFSNKKKTEPAVQTIGGDENDWFAPLSGYSQAAQPLRTNEGAMSELDIERQDLERMTDQQFLKNYGISKEFWKYKNQAVLKKPARRPMSAQLARSPVGKKMNAMYGSACPGCGRSTNPDRCICESTQRLHAGDPIIVTAPNEFEGATGEIYELSPSGKFVVVDLYNHGKHSMHISDIEYNKYADQDDWYDDADEFGKPGSEFFSEAGNPKLAAIVKNIQARVPAAAVKRPEIMQRVAQMVAQADPTVPDAMATAQQLVQQYGQGAPAPAQTNVNDIKAQARSGNAMAQLPKTSAGTPTYAQQHSTFEGFQDFNKVEPYAVCLAGKPVKKFDYYEQARRFHDNWKKKLYREGNKEKADKITLMPLNLDEDVKTIKGAHGRLDVDTNTPGVTKVRQKDRLGAKTFTKDPYRVGGSRIGQKSPDTSRGSSLNSTGAYNRNPSGRTFPRLDHSDDSNQLAHYSAEAANAAQQAAIAIAMKKAGKKPKNESDDYDDGDWTDDPEQHVVVKAQQPTRYPEAVLRAIERNPAMRADIIADYKRKQGVAETALNPRDPAGDYAAKRKALQDLGMNKAVDQAAVLQRRLDLDREARAKGVAEAETDYSKRRQRERDVDAGRPVKPLPKNPQTDYARKRAKERRDLEQFGEGSDLINMSDLQFYKELLGVMVIPVAAFGAMAWNKAMNAIKLYRAEDVVTALQKKGVTVDRSTLEQIKPLLLKLEQAIDVDKDGDVAKELAKRIQQTVTWGKLKQANPRTDAKTKNTELGEEFEMPGTTIPQKSVIRGYVVYYNPKTKIVSITRRGDSEEAAIEQARLGKPGMQSFETTVSKLINRLEQDLVESEEGSASDAVEQAILRRIMVAHTDLLKQFGPEKVMQAAEEVAYNVGDVDEIGTSDVSAYVNQVRQILGAE